VGPKFVTLANQVENSRWGASHARSTRRFTASGEHLVLCPPAFEEALSGYRGGDERAHLPQVSVIRTSFRHELGYGSLVIVSRQDGECG